MTLLPRGVPFTIGIIASLGLEKGRKRRFGVEMANGGAAARLVGTSKGCFWHAFLRQGVQSHPEPLPGWPHQQACPGMSTHSAGCSRR